MFDNVFKALKKIFSNEESYNKFSELKEWDDVYNECVRANPECSELEFYRFLLCLFEIITGEKIRIPISDTDIIPVESTEDVSGGANWRNRLAAATLAATSAFAGISGNYVRAVEVLNPNELTSSKSPKPTAENKPGRLSQIFGTIKQKISQIAGKVWEHKGKIVIAAIGSVLIGLGGKYVYDQYTLKKALLDATIDEREDAQANITNYNFTQSLADMFGRNNAAGKVLIAGSSIFGALGSLWSAGMGLIDIFGKLGDNIKKTSDGMDKVKNYVEQKKRELDDAITQGQKGPYDKTESWNQLLQDLCLLKGQEKAKKLIKSVFHRVIADRERSAYTGVRDKAKVIVFNGPSGCGKSMSARILAESLTNGPIYTMSASEIDPKSSQTIVQQLFAKNVYSWDDSGSSFSSYIKKNAGQGVIIINEYDKMFRLNGNAPHELDEILRTWIDEGIANLYGKNYDCSGITFILTTNESRASLKGEVTVDSYGMLNDPSKLKDTTGSLTSVIHDKSFLNRLTIVEFENLTAEAYTEIAKQSFSSTIEFLGSEYGDYTNVILTEESYKKMGECLSIINEGARPLEKFVGELFVNIVTAKNKIRDNGEDVDHLTFRASFDYTSTDYWFDVELLSSPPEIDNSETNLNPKRPIFDDPPANSQPLDPEKDKIKPYDELSVLDSNKVSEELFDNQIEI